MILGLPAIFGFLPLLIYIIISFKGADMLWVVLLCVIIGAVLTGQTPITFGNAIASGIGSFLGLIGFIILLGAGLGELLTQTGVAQNIVYLVMKKTGVKSKKQVMLATMFASTLLVSLLGSMAGGNAILAPIIIPIVASFGITPSALGVLLHGAGASGLYIGPFVPTVVTTLGLTGLSYGQYMKYAGIPVSLIVLVSTYFVALKVQKNTEGKESYGKEDMVDTSNFEPDARTKKATFTFAAIMILSIVYGIYAKAGASFVITVMGITSLAVGYIAGLKPDETLKAIVKGSSRMYWLFILFVLYDPFLNFVTQSGAFDAIASYIKPLINAGGKPIFMILTTLIGIFGVSGAAVAQEKVVHTMFFPLVQQLNFPMTLWAIVLLVGSQITFFAYPTGDMVGQMGLARSKDLKSMVKNGLVITVLNLLYVAIVAFLYRW
ncbi:H+/gluconate symporter-like permease [Clostridium tetanomorphum]|uniref:TRAP transporter large permease subunit n=1 Tax=Clostridium tetanomorphum TaxID=1553 RepID=A0A923E6Y1_CLOTT|nr:Na+/H+ antiporter NhaC family protein [Clostridium tetanomorphum]KAJ50985.1 citrate transporter [Clostridium tetanomorphum DSM 665]MBC2396352.1 TRAP transporter large permease subunit [Clostridium tetanomorphum]MBP1863419.1 H+/gluconate symporter-like permease [Clostridium tetanomorphum]NRS83516.1 H+/gluconate symporter-like permease [Clostridium tetanomorphum]NRZ96716.1 H+/gluconate symporter-like permease [Clostridium tetanomorphum]